MKHRHYGARAAVGTPSREYVYGGATLLAKFESGGTTYYHPDRLSNRVLSDASGNIVGQRGNFPFGEIWYESGTTTKLKFTSYERDAESGNDFAMARYYVNRLARFSALDPMSGSASAPQSLNRYSYSGNDPVNAADPSGMMMIALYLSLGGGGFGGDYGCEIDGLDSSCSTARKLLDDGAGVACSGNDCRIGTSTPFQCVGSVCGYMSNQFASTHENEWNGILYSNSEWQDFKVDSADAQRQALADAISYASNGPNGSNWDYIYDHLNPYKPGTEDLDIQGGNVDFTWTGDDSYLSFVPQSAWDTAGCTLCRYGSMGAIHFDHGLFHLDTASPTWGFGLGLFLHGFVDVFLGNIDGSIPIGR